MGFMGQGPHIYWWCERVLHLYTKLHTQEHWKDVIVATTELWKISVKIEGRLGGCGWEYVNTGGGDLTLMVGLILEYCMPKTQLLITLNHDSLVK